MSGGGHLTPKVTVMRCDAGGDKRGVLTGVDTVKRATATITGVT